MGAFINPFMSKAPLIPTTLMPGSSVGGFHTLSEGNLRLTDASGSSANHSIRAIGGHRTGRHAFEVESIKNQSSAQPGIGLWAPELDTQPAGAGMGGASIGWYNNGELWAHNVVRWASGAPQIFVGGKQLVEVDLDSRTIYVRSNSPAVLTTISYTGYFSAGTLLVPIISTMINGDDFRVNFGQSAFANARQFANTEGWGSEP